MYSLFICFYYPLTLIKISRSRESKGWIANKAILFHVNFYYDIIITKVMYGSGHNNILRSSRRKNIACKKRINEFQTNLLRTLKLSCLKTTHFFRFILTDKIITNKLFLFHQKLISSSYISILVLHTLSKNEISLTRGSKG